MLTEQQIIKWIIDFENKYDDYPNYKSGIIDGTDETWENINIYMKNGLTNLHYKISLQEFILEVFFN